MSVVSEFLRLALFLLVHFAECSLSERNEADAHRNSSSSNNKHQENYKKSFDIQVHGIILWASMGFLMPIGILTMRMSSCTRDFNLPRHRILYHVHAVSQVLSVLVVTVGAILSIRKFENTFDNIHQRIGLGLYAAIYLQVVIGFKRPKRGSKSRRAWYFLHWVLGTATSLVGILNVYTGLRAYHERTSKNTTHWTLIFTAQVCFMAVFYLFQDKWDYMMKQGVIYSAQDDAQIESQTKEALSEPCRKSNALGTHFLRTNALNKLFQLT